MAKLTRITVVPFGLDGASTDFGQFGSKTAAAPQTSQNPSVIMQLAAWTLGWTAAAVGAAFNPYLEDMNGFCLVVMYFLDNLFERGVPDWIATTTYYQGALVQDPAGSGQFFYSLTDNNLNNALPLGASNAQWRWQNPPALLVGASATVTAIPKVTAVAAAGGQPGSVAMADSALTDDGSYVKTSLPLKFPNNSIQTVAAQPVSTRINGVPGRVLNTVYTNATGKTMNVDVTIAGTAAGGSVAAVGTIVSSSNLVVASASVAGIGSSTSSVHIHFVVLPGETYKVTATQGSISHWIETY